jgi:hypothetical protein
MYLEANPVFSEYYLVRATVDGSEMKKDDWGLVQINDPDFIFSTTPWPNPFFHLTVEEHDNLSEDEGKILDAWFDDVDKFAGELVDSTRHVGNKQWRFEALVKLGMAAHKVGYVAEGHRLPEWMFQYLGELLTKFPNPMPPDPAMQPATTLSGVPLISPEETPKE